MRQEEQRRLIATSKYQKLDRFLKQSAVSTDVTDVQVQNDTENSQDFYAQQVAAA